MPERGRVAVFTGCFAEPYEETARAAIVRLLGAMGFRAHFPAPTLCCGAIHAHAGDAGTAERLGAALQAAYRDEAIVLSLASGCHESLGRALDGRALDASAFLARHADALSFSPRPETIALHLPCTQRNVARSDGAVRELLARVPALKVVVLDAGHGCCGAAGTAMLTDAARAQRLRQPLLDQLAASGAGRLLSANIGCRLHLGNGTRLPVQHPLEFLADCLR